MTIDLTLCKRHKLSKEGRVTVRGIQFHYEAGSMDEVIGVAMQENFNAYRFVAKGEPIILTTDTSDGGLKTTVTAHGQCDFYRAKLSIVIEEILSLPVK